MHIAYPPLGLRNRHVQTIVNSLPLRATRWRRNVAALQHDSIAVVLRLTDARLMGYYCPGTDPERGLAVLLHGWEGGANARYLLTLAAALAEEGYATFRLNFRDHGGTHGLNRELFHSCRIDEVVQAVGAIAEQYAPSRLAIVGYSLGGNFALRVGARAEGAGLSIERIVAVCPVLHPPATMAALETGLWIYRHYYLQRWRQSLRTKAALFPGAYAFGDLRRLETLTATTEFFVSEYTEYPNMAAYLNGYSIIGAALSTLNVPSRIIAASDDPIIPRDDLARLSPRPTLDVTVLPWGGHCGFVQSYTLTSAVEAMIVLELNG
jgi:predicted alpha/beta-fold hydrolase